ncbi:hypothetical protein ABJI51_33045 [Amycolatopsis sp. NEAU-NG30]|uniref:Type VII secretion protein EccB n=1 Tax=Amycolatopsis melonis TaxID=3156488 RepID=A0ABV0LR20_9PSEU
MSNDLGLPPRRELPDDVRARLRAEVRRGMASRRPSRAWYAAAAAAVVLLAAGAVVATQVIRQPVATPGPAPAPDPGPGDLTLDTQVATTALDRCWAAVQSAGKADRVPPRAEWVPLFTEVLQTDAVVAATAAGKPLFCETTETTVTLSDPGATPARTPGTGIGLLLHSPTGTVGGVTDRGAENAYLTARTLSGESVPGSVRSSPVTGQFVTMMRTDPARTTMTLERAPFQASTVLAAAPPPLLSVTDRPLTADRTSPAGRALGDCLAAAEEEVVPDAAAFAPGPLLQNDRYQVVTGRRDGRVVVCATQPDYGRAGKTRSRAYPEMVGPQTPPVRVVPAETLGMAEAGGDREKWQTPFVLALPLTAAKATIDFGIGTSAEVGVVDGMALTWLPKNIARQPETKVHVVVRDAQDRTLYDGLLSLF